MQASADCNGPRKWLPLAPLILLILVASIACAQAVADLGFTTKVSAALTAQYARKFGASVPDRFSRWQAFAREQKAVPYARSLDTAKGREAEILQIVNDAINQIVKAAVPGARVYDLCVLGDRVITEATGKIYKDKKITKGVSERAHRSF